MTVPSRKIGGCLSVRVARRGISPATQEFAHEGCMPSQSCLMQRRIATLLDDVRSRPGLQKTRGEEKRKFRIRVRRGTVDGWGVGCMQWLGGTMNGPFHCDQIEFGTGDVIDPSLDLPESQLAIERLTLRVLFLDVEAQPLCLGKGATRLVHHSFADALALKLWQDVHARDEQNLTLRMRRYHPDDSIRSTRRYTHVR